MTTPNSIQFNSNSIARITNQDELIQLALYLGMGDDWHAPGLNSVNCIIRGETFGDMGYWGTVNGMWNSTDPSKLEFYCALYRDGILIAEVNLANLFAMACHEKRVLIMPDNTKAEMSFDHLYVDSRFDRATLHKWLYENTVKTDDTTGWNESSLEIQPLGDHQWSIQLNLQNPDKSYYYLGRYKDTQKELCVVSTLWSAPRMFECIDLEAIKEGLAKQMVTRAGETCTLYHVYQILSAIDPDLSAYELIHQQIENSSDNNFTELCANMDLDLSSSIKDELADNNEVDWLEIAQRLRVDTEPMAEELVDQAIRDGSVDEKVVINCLDDGYDFHADDLVASYVLPDGIANIPKLSNADFIQIAAALEITISPDIKKRLLAE